MITQAETSQALMKQAFDKICLETEDMMNNEEAKTILEESTTLLAARESDLQEANQAKETRQAQFEDLKSKQTLISLELDKASNLDTYFSNGQTILYDAEMIKNGANLVDGISLSLAQNAEISLEKMISNQLLAK